MEIVRVSRQAELKLCLGIRTAVFVEEQRVPPALELDEYDVSPDACRHVLIRDEGVPVAAGRCRMYEERTAKIQRVAVAAERRGRGVGRLLMAALEEDARDLGADSVVLDAQCDAEPFYVKLGYRTVSAEPFLDAGIRHVRMRKAL